MIQRIQTVYLLLATLIAALLPFLLPLWETEAGKDFYAEDKMLVFFGFIISAVMAFITIFLYKNRKLQFVLGRINILLNFVILGFFVYWLLMVPGEMQISEKGIGLLIPIVSIVFLVLANKAIKKDEALVKSVDRLR